MHGAYLAAAEQLELARKGGDGDFYELSAVDARLREIRAKMTDEQRRREQQRKSERRQLAND